MSLNAKLKAAMSAAEMEGNVQIVTKDGRIVPFDVDTSPHDLLSGIHVNAAAIVNPYEPGKPVILPHKVWGSPAVTGLSDAEFDSEDAACADAEADAAEFGCDRAVYFTIFNHDNGKFSWGTVGVK